MKRILMVVCTCMVFVACSRGGKPSETYNEFVSLLEKGDMDAAYQLVDKQSRAALDQRGGVANLNASMAHIKGHRGIKEIKVTGEEQKGDAAASSAVVSFNDGFSGEVINRFVKEEGKWRLVVK